MINFEQNWHALTINQVLTELTATNSGLSSAEAEKRLKIYGPNKTQHATQHGAVFIFFNQFNNVLVLVLFIAALITLSLNYWFDTSIILGVIIANVIIGFIQEYKAENKIAAIQQSMPLKAKVLRGKWLSIPAEQLLPGDIIQLKSGDKVPADIRLVETNYLQIQEAYLTGESLPVEKNSNPVDKDNPLAERSCIAYASTIVVFGQGIGVVIATANRTEIARIDTSAKKQIESKPPLIRKINQITKIMTLAVLSLAMLTLIYGFYIRGFPLSEILLISVSLAVAAVPESLPAIITIALAIGASRMARHNAIVRRLSAIETLGSVTVIATDKTGTLTQNKLSIDSIITRCHKLTISELKIINERISFEIKQLLISAILCSNIDIDNKINTNQITANSIDQAILELNSIKIIHNYLEQNQFTLTDLLPFESQNKMMAALYCDKDNKAFIFIKGAPEIILKACDFELKQDNVVNLNRAYWLTNINQLAMGGQRVIAIAMRAIPLNNKINLLDIKQDFIFLGVISLLDPPRQEAITAIAQCRSAGIKIKIITGDHAETARSIAKQLGLPNIDKIITGSDIEQLSSSSLANIIESVDIFARTSPIDKLKIIEALKTKNHIVAMTGDGVNDTPALKAADVGIAMGKKGTEAAKDAAEIILSDDDFDSIAQAVRIGRTSYNNLKKAIYFILPTEIAEAIIIFCGIIFTTTLPITPLQIFWVELITTTTLACALLFEPEESNIMQLPPRPVNESIISNKLLWRISITTILIVTMTFSAFTFTYNNTGNIAKAHTIAINILVFSEIFYLISCRQLSKSSLTMESFKNSLPVFIFISIVIILQLSLTYLSILNSLFNTTAISYYDWLIILCLAFCVFLTIELEKYITNKYALKRHNPK